MKDQLIIVFAKNILLGKVKTRLAKTIGDYGAFDVYKYLVDITERETSHIDFADKHIYFSDVIIESKWPNDEKFVQEGDDLGQRLENAFRYGFEQGYQKIIGVGADLPDLTKEIIIEAFEKLNSNELVFGPASDGGYYLLGMRELNTQVFRNKPWSKESLLETTLQELNENDLSFGLMKELNDIDTLEDLKSSSVANKFTKYYDLSRRDK